MQKQAPTLGRLLVMAGFALSCFGLILFLWVAFGGPTPLAAKGYQVKVDFANAGQLASQADVRISGVPVGKVAKVELGPRNTTEATLQIDPQYSPIPLDSRAILRTKTLLGETYVELTPGNRQSGTPVADGGMLPERQVKEQVTLDQIFQTFDAETRAGFQKWQQGAAASYAGRGGDINDAFGNLPSFTDSADQTLAVLNAQSDAVQKLVRDTGVVFGALSERGSQLTQLVTNSNTVFTTTALRNQELAQTFEYLPTFEAESKKTVEALQKFAISADPLVLQLQPAAEQLSPLLVSAGQFATPLEQVTTTLNPLTDASIAGVPALTRVLNGDPGNPQRKSLASVLGSLDPFLQELNPIVNMLGIYKKDLGAFLGNTAAATQARDKYGSGLHYLRVVAPFAVSSLAAFPQRATTNRANAYAAPGVPSLDQSGYETRQCNGGSFTPVPPTTGPDSLPYHDQLKIPDWIKNIAFAGGTTPLAPSCSQQASNAVQGGVNPSGYDTLFPLVTKEP